MAAPVVFPANANAGIDAEAFAAGKGEELKVTGRVFAFVNFIHPGADRLVIVVIDSDLVAKEGFGIRND